ncbi:MAG: metalloregulator ArsR/SmtB family transcription factor [Nocardioides sp.]|nr:metalloregulator ArsR/SmtB family transcription factor [Nocardioides sp.]
MDANSFPLDVTDEDVSVVVEVFGMLADATRVRLLWALRDGEMTVSELAETVGKPAASVSQHLAKLRLARLVHTRRQGTHVYYRVENTHVMRLVTDAIHHADHLGSEAPRHHAGVRAVTA